jgi:pyridoxamine 5'-phosphate oxidase family protein
MTRDLTAAERAYLRSQRLGRLATVDASGAPQNNPVAFALTDDGQILIGGYHMGDSRKFRNVQRNEHVAFVVDDLKTIDPWAPRMVELRGTAEALTDVDPPLPGMSREVICITPTRIITFGLD